MKDAAFRELLTSVRQAGRIRRGRLKAGDVARRTARRSRCSMSRRETPKR